MLDALKLKIPPVLLTALFALEMWLLVPVLPVLQLPGWLALSLSGAVLVLALYCCLFGVLEFRRHQTTVDPRSPDKSSALVNTGVYARSRNPMYLGFSLILLAWALFWQSPWLILAVPLFVLYMNHFQIKPEEASLTALFGAAYQQYCQQVRRWF